MMPADADQQHASERLRLAEQSPDVKEGTAWRELALCWLGLSEHMTRYPSTPGIRSAASRSARRSSSL